MSDCIQLFLPYFLGLAFHGCCMKYGWLRFLAKPVDGGRMWRGSRIFGENKMWRGIVAVALGTGAGYLLTGWLSESFQELLGHSMAFIFLIGCGVGAAAMLGEFPNSFVKRRLGVAPGRTAQGWVRPVLYVADQVDILLGAWAVLWWLVWPAAGQVMFSVLFVLVLHQGGSIVGHRLGMRERVR